MQQRSQLRDNGVLETQLDAYQEYIAHKRAAEATEPLYEWQEFSPESHESYRCRQCGRRWQDTEVYPDPARKAWTCRNCHGMRWVYAPPGRQIWTNVERRRYRTSAWTWFAIIAVAEWLLSGMFLRLVVYNGSDLTAYMSNAERWGAPLAISFALNLVVIWPLAALMISGHAGKVEERHGWGPWVTWPYPPTS